MQIFQEKDAISLGGGGSSAMIIGSQKVSYPHAPDTMRKVANVIGFKYKADANVETSPPGIEYPIHWQSEIVSMLLLENTIELKENGKSSTIYQRNKK